MKISLRKHFFFWMVFLIWDVSQSFVSMLSSGDTITKESFIAMLMAGGIFIVVRGILAYFLFFTVFLPFLKGSINKILLTGVAVITVVSFVFLQRAALFYYIYPYMFRMNMEGRKYFNLYAFFVILFDLLVPVSLFHIMILYNYFRQAKEQSRLLEKEKLKSELKFLKTQINPHFLFNVLSTIHALTRKDAPQAANVVMQLSEILRFVLYKADGQDIQIQEEVTLLEDYLNLEQTRFNNKLEVNFVKKLSDGKKRIAPLLLLPFLENAIKHGVSESRFKAYINIALETNDNHLFFTITNSFEQKKNNNSVDGIGLANVKRRLQLLYPSHRIDIKEAINNFSVQLELNLSENDKIIVSDNRR